MDIGVTIVAILGGIATAVATLYKTVISPVLHEIKTDYEEKIKLLEIRHSVQMEKMDKELAQCQRERESAILWRARYEERIRQLEKVSIEGKITARADEKGVLRILTTNVGATKIFGYTRVELVGMPVEDLISPKDRDLHLNKAKKHSLEHWREFNRVLNGGLAMDKNGRLFPVTVELESILVNGKPAWAAIITQD